MAGTVGSPPPLWPRRAAWVALLGCAALQLWAQRFHMGPDGLSYLDLADAWRSGNLEQAANSYWSPGYPALLAVVLGLLRPTPPWEASVVHLLHLPLSALAMLAFEVFWRRAAPSSARGLPGWAWWSLGYGLFIWATLVLVTVWQVTPDVLVAVWLFLGAAWLLGTEESSPRRQIVFGVGWAAAYLTKLVLLPVGGLVLVLDALRQARRGQPGPALRGLALASGVFACLAGPWVAQLSNASGRLTAGDAGRLNYAWYVNGIFGGGQHWQGEEPAQGRALHPTRRLHRNPEVFEFREPVVGTYPPWANPAYWHEGVRLTFNLKRQLEVVRVHLAIYGEVFGGRLLLVLLGSGALWMLGGRPRREAWGRAWPLLVLAVGPLCLYALVHVELRFLGALVVFAGAALWTTLRWPGSPAGGRLATGVVVGMVAFLLFSSAWNTAAMAVRQREAVLAWRGTEAHAAWRVAEALGQAGMAPGGEVVYVGYGMNAYWARLAGVRIVADVYSRADLPELAGNADRFWSLEPVERAEIVQLFEQVQAQAVVSRGVPPSALREGWRALGTTGYFVLAISPEPSAVSSSSKDSPK